MFRRQHWRAKQNARPGPASETATTMSWLWGITRTPVCFRCGPFAVCAQGGNTNGRSSVRYDLSAWIDAPLCARNDPPVWESAHHGCQWLGIYCLWRSQSLAEQLFQANTQKAKLLRIVLTFLCTRQTHPNGHPFPCRQTIAGPVRCRVCLLPCNYRKR
jgi:hypothetical protein